MGRIAAFVENEDDTEGQSLRLDNGPWELLTNKERWRRRLTANQECGRCQLAVEDVMHAIKDCPWAHEVWDILIPRCSQTQFFELEMERWLLWILRGEGSAERNL